MSSPSTLPKGNSIYYGLTSRLIHQPGLLRAGGALLRRAPGLAKAFNVAATRGAVTAVLTRPTSFSNTAHEAALTAGPFAIGMEAGPLHDADRRRLESILPDPAAFATASDTEARTRIATIRSSQAAVFDLVEDYMTGVAWSGLRLAFGPAAAAIEGGSTKQLFAEIRYLGAQLIIGKVAPARIQRRAHESAEALRARILPHIAALRSAWAGKAAGDDAAVLRNAIGLPWVGHPAMVQAGALIVQELLARPKLHQRLQQQARELGQGAAADAERRGLLRPHVMELLRFRPTFPILPRDVPRATEFDLVAGRACPVKAGSSLIVLAISALFDPAGLDHPKDYLAGRADDAWFDSGDRYLPFGGGPRRCIAARHVPEVLVSALSGLLTLPRLRYADPWYRRVEYDGPIITRMRLAFDR